MRGNLLLLFLLTALPAVFACGTHDPNGSGTPPPPPAPAIEGPYYQDFLHYWQTMDQGYAYFDEKGVDWYAVFQAYEPLAFAENDLSSFRLMLAKITASLSDSHTWSSLAGVPVERLPYRPATGICLERSEGRVFVSRLTEQARQAGVEPGDEVILIDGKSVDEVLTRAVSWEGCSTPHCCDFFRLPHVDRFSSGEEHVVYTLVRDAVQFDVMLSRSGGGQGSCKPRVLTDFLEDASGVVLKYKPVDHDLGYLHLSTLSGSYKDQILADLDQALSEFSGRSGLIFDARYNRGGSDLTAMAVLSRFLDHLVCPVLFRYRNGPEHDAFTAWIPHPVFPGQGPVLTPVVFLINGACVSAADFFAAAASFVSSFTLLGTDSCGGTGAPKDEALPASDVVFTYSQMQRKHTRTGEQIEGVGIAPDVFVEQDPTDTVRGVDTQLEAAIALLRQGIVADNWGK